LRLGAPAPRPGGTPHADQRHRAATGRLARGLPLPAALPRAASPQRDDAADAASREGSPHALLAGRGRRMNASADAPILAVTGLVKHYESGGLLQRRRPPVRAVDGVSFEIGRGETLALVGES